MARVTSSIARESALVNLVGKLQAGGVLPETRSADVEESDGMDIDA
jgi:hypothetical protein